MKVALEDIIVLRLSRSTIGTTRTMSGDNIELIQGETETVSRQRLRVQKETIPKQFLKTIRELDAAFTNRFYRMTLPGFFGAGDRITHVEKIGPLNELVAEYRKDREKLVTQFVSQLDEIKEAAKKDLCHLYNESDYPKTPKEAEEAFDVQFFALELNAHSKLPGEVKKTMDQAIEKQWEETLVAGKKTLRDEFFKLATTLLGELKPEKGKKGKIYDSVVENFQMFLAEFETRDLTGDAELGKLVSTVKKVLSECTPDDLRNHQKTKDTVTTVLSGIQPQAEELIRVIDLD